MVLDIDLNISSVQKSMNKDLYTMSKIEQEIKIPNPCGILSCITINLL